jgi:hypothetical protein
MNRRFDKLLSEGKGKQFFWLLGVVAIVLVIALGVGFAIYDKLQWQQVVAVLLDPGCYGSFNGDFGWVLLPMAVFSLIFLSGLLVSTFTNVVENISESARMGRRRYHVNGHTLILGAGRQLAPILEALKDSDKTVVVMSEKRPAIMGNYIYYCGKRDSKDDLRSARPEHAKTIYIIGEYNEPNHDSKTIKAIELLNELTTAAEEKVYCYATLLDRVSSEIYEYSRLTPNGKLLLVDVINDYEYLSQLLMFNTDFLPAIKLGDKRRSHIVIFGNDHLAQNVAYTAAHISHYGNFDKNDSGTKTCITIIGEDMRRKLDNLLAARPGLFDLSVYTYIDADGNKEVHTPKSDFLDIEWQFIDTYSTSQLARRIVTDIHHNAEKEILTIVVANEDPTESTRTVLHLPREVYSNHIAVYMEHSADAIELSRKSGMYGDIIVFGAAGTLSDPLFQKRSIMGQRVNYIYYQTTSNPPYESAEKVWYSASESNKYSSIYCAIALPMCERCFDMNGDRSVIYETEHRRWMMSVLIMGWHAGAKRDNTTFTHNDIVPFDKLSEEEQMKDKVLIDALPDILGKGQPY